MPDKPPVTTELIWAKNLEFGATSGTNALVVDGDSAAGLSPVQLLAVALAACMSIDVVDILKKGRHPLTAFRSRLTGNRSPKPPRRLLAVQMEFTIHGDIPPLPSNVRLRSRVTGTVRYGTRFVRTSN